MASTSSFSPMKLSSSNALCLAVGAGPLGLELAQALARLNVETVVSEQSDHLTPLFTCDAWNRFEAPLMPF